MGDDALKKNIKKFFEKYDSLSITIKAGIWFTFCNVVVKGIGFITAPIFSRLLTSSEYGILTVYMSFEQIILTLATWEIALSAYQKGLFKYKDDIRYFTSATQLFSNLITILFFSICLMFYPTVSNFTGLDLIDFLLLFLYMLFQPAYSCWIVSKRTEFKYKQAVFVTLLYSILSVIFPLITIFLTDKTAQIKFRSTLIISICLYFLFYLKSSNYVFLFKTPKKTFHQWKFIVLYQMPIVIHALSFTFLAQSDRIMISKLVGDAEAGFYSIAYSIANIAALFTNSFNQVLVPWRFKHLENKEYESIKNNTSPLLIFISLIMIAFVFISPEALKILFSKEYYAAVWCIPPVALSVYFIFLYSMFVCVENYYEKTGYVAIVSVICAAINIILNYLLIGIFGYIVCGYTTAFSYLLFCIGHYIFMKMACKQSGVNETIYNIKSTVIISLMTMLITVATTLLYPYPIIRYAVLSITVIVCIVKRKSLLQYIKNIMK